MVSSIAPHRFSVDQYKRMIASGILSRDDHVELLRGLVITKPEYAPMGAVPLAVASEFPPTTVFHRFTVEQYKQMIREGIIGEDDRVELLRGEIVEKMGIVDEHAACVDRLNDLLRECLGRKVIVRSQNPLQLPTSMPEPDVMLLKRRKDYYSSRTPRPADLFLVIEVAESSLGTDRTTKSALYAEAGITEYWIVNLIDRCVEVYRDPAVTGQWKSHVVYRARQAIELLAFPGVSLAVTDILS
jgi:Uma2 family endonuclease